VDKFWAAFFKHQHGYFLELFLQILYADSDYHIPTFLKYVEDKNHKIFLSLSSKEGVLRFNTAVILSKFVEMVENIGQYWFKLHDKIFDYAFNLTH